MTGRLEIRCSRGDTGYRKAIHRIPHLTPRQEHHQRCWVMGCREQAFLLVILPHPGPPGPRERTQEDFLVIHFFSLPSMLVFIAWAELARCAERRGGTPGTPSWRKSSQEIGSCGIKLGSLYAVGTSI